MRENSHQRMKAGSWALVVAALTLCAFAKAQDGPDALEFKILGLESQWNAAYKRSDVSAMNSLLADDFIITEEDGSTFSKPGYIAHNGNASMRVEVSDMSDLKVRIHGNTAVVTGMYHEKGTEKGKAYEYYDRFTDVWMNNKGTWQVIVSHYSSRTRE
jgi:ketosteroid isomerase-like protein